VLFSLLDLEVPNEDGVSILFYLQKIFPGFFLSFPFGAVPNSRSASLCFDHKSSIDT